MGNKDYDSIIPAWRQGAQFRVWLSDVKGYDHEDSETAKQNNRLRREHLRTADELSANMTRLGKARRTPGLKQRKLQTIGLMREISMRDFKERQGRLSGRQEGWRNKSKPPSGSAKRRARRCVKDPT